MGLLKGVGKMPEMQWDRTDRQDSANRILDAKSSTEPPSDT